MIAGRISLGRVMGAIRRRGLARILVLAVELGFGRLYPHLRRLESALTDWRYGIDTRGREPVATLGIDSPNQAHSYYYESIPERSFRKCLGALPSDLAEFEFIDVGCGKGRLLVFATRYNFKAISGLEYSRRLVEVARANLARHRARHPGETRLSVAFGDAAELDLKDGQPTVLFFFNPFKRAVTEAVVARLNQWRRRNPTTKMYVIWWNCRIENNDFAPLFTLDWATPIAGVRSAAEDGHGVRYVVLASQQIPLAPPPRSAI